MFCGQNIDRTYCLHFIVARRQDVLYSLLNSSAEMSVGGGAFEAGAAIDQLQPCAKRKLDNPESGVHPHTVTLLTSETSLPHTYHKGEGTVGSSKQFESTSHGRQ